MNKEQRRELNQLLMDVHRCRSVVDESVRFAETAKNAQQRAEARVRTYCRENGLDLPADIPAEDIGGEGSCDGR